MNDNNIPENLINEFVEQRNAIKEMIKELEIHKAKIDTLFGKSLDSRYLKFFEERVKTLTELFKIILDMRKEIIKNTKDEFELRRKLSSGEDDDIDGIVDIKKIADKVERLRKDKILLEQTLNKTDDEPKSITQLSVVNNKGE